jgi:hypothetical protein
MEFAINQLRTVDLSNYMVDATTNLICCHSINLLCTICRKTMHREFFICSKCYGVSHKACASCQIGTSQHGQRGDINVSRSHGCNNRPKSFPTPTLCFLCNRPWMPFTVGCSGKYRNLSTILEHFRYPLLHSAKRKLTYPSPEHVDSASPTSSLTVTRSPACPSLADIHHYPTGKGIREV